MGTGLPRCPRVHPGLCPHVWVAPCCIHPSVHLAAPGEGSVPRGARVGQSDTGQPWQNQPREIKIFKKEKKKKKRKGKERKKEKKKHPTGLYIWSRNVKSSIPREGRCRGDERSPCARRDPHSPLRCGAGCGQAGRSGAPGSGAAPALSRGGAEAVPSRPVRPSRGTKSPAESRRPARPPARHAALQGCSTSCCW